MFPGRLRQLRVGNKFPPRVFSIISKDFLRAFVAQGELLALNVKMCQRPAVILTKCEMFENSDDKSTYQYRRKYFVQYAKT